MKYVKKLIIFGILAALVVGYYYYVSHRVIGDKSDRPMDSQVAKLVTRDLDGVYYPEMPRGVVDLYAQITKAYYFTNLTDDEIKALGLQAKKLFDAELAEKNPDAEFLQRLKAEINAFQKNKVRINDYSVQKAGDIKTFTHDGISYAKVGVVYYFYENEGKTRNYVYQMYTLRKSAEGRWGILYWEPVKKEEVMGE